MPTLQETVCFKLMVLRDAIHDHSKSRFQEIGITYGNYVTMLLIHEHPGVTQAGLAELNHKDRNVTGQTIDKLEKKQFVRRVREAQDRRAYTLYLTDEGERVVRDDWDTVVAGERQVLQKLSAEEQAQFRGLLDQLLS